MLIFQREDYRDKEGKCKNWLLVLYGVAALTFSLGSTIFFKIFPILTYPNPIFIKRGSLEN